MLGEVPPGDDPEWPFLLSAGERRSFTANTIFRDPAWRKRDPDGALRVAPTDAAALGLADGGRGLPDDRAGRAPSSRSPSTTACTPATSPCPTALGLDHLDDDGRVTDRRRPERADRPVRTATAGPARRGTSRCRPGSNRCEAGGRFLGSADAARARDHPLRRRRRVGRVAGRAPRAPGGRVAGHRQARLGRGVGDERRSGRRRAVLGVDLRPPQGARRSPGSASATRPAARAATGRR